MISVENHVDPAESPACEPSLLHVLKLVAEGLSFSASVPAAITEIQELDPFEAPSPSQLARWHAEVTPFVAEVRAARELRRQRALAAVSAARKDPASGLPGVTSAQAELEKAISGGQGCAVAVLVLEQLRVLNARFGRAIGDEILALAAMELARQLADLGTLFRWNGPALLLVSNTPLEKLSLLETRLHELASNRIEKTIEVENRSIHLKLTFTWHLRTLDASTGVIDVSRALDDVVTSRTTGK